MKNTEKYFQIQGTYSIINYILCSRSMCFLKKNVLAIVSDAVLTENQLFI